MHWLKIGQVLHEQVIILCLVVTAEPRVKPEDRLRVVEHDRNLFGVEAHFGFMEEINITRLEPELRKIAVVPANRNLYYLLGRECIIFKTRWNPMARAYRFLSGLSRPIPEALNIPTGQVIEIGTAIRL